MFPRFSGVRTFFRLPILDDKSLKEADVAIVGAPFDGGTSFRPGARFSPEHVRSMSVLGRGYHPSSDVHIFKSLKIGDLGDIAITPQDIEKTHAQIRAEVSRILQSRTMPFIIGGDHSTTIGSMQAVVDHYGPIGVVHFDAHTDAYPAAWGCDVHHGTFMRLGHERGWFRKNDVIQIGIRGPFSSEDDEKTPREFGFHVVTVDDVREQGAAEARERIKQIGRGPVYVSVDVDCLDPAFAPGTGTPVPGGLTSHELFQMLRGLSELDVVAADVVEISPPYDVSGITGLAGVAVIYEILAAVAKRRQVMSA